MDHSDRKRKSRRSGCARNRRTIVGGTYTAAYSFGGPLLPGGATDAHINAPITDCGNPVRAAVNPGPPGLPGMSGGRRRKSRRLSGNVTGYFNNAGNPIPLPLGPKPRKLVGGRWGFGTPEVVGSGIALSARDHVPCEASRATIPQIGGVGGPDSMFLRSPNAGYTNTFSGPLSAAGTPIMTQTGYPASGSVSACSHTGGYRKSRRNRKNRKASRKNRKASRKNRKASRKNRKSRKASRRN